MFLTINFKNSNLLLNYELMNSPVGLFNNNKKKKTVGNAVCLLIIKSIIAEIIYLLPVSESSYYACNHTMWLTGTVECSRAIMLFVTLISFPVRQVKSNEKDLQLKN